MSKPRKRPRNEYPPQDLRHEPKTPRILYARMTGCECVPYTQPPDALMGKNPSVYRYSDRWQFWTPEKRLEIQPYHMSASMLHRLRKDLDD